MHDRALARRAPLPHGSAPARVRKADLSLDEAPSAPAGRLPPLRVTCASASAGSLLALDGRYPFAELPPEPAELFLGGPANRAHALVLGLHRACGVYHARRTGPRVDDMRDAGVLLLRTSRRRARRGALRLAPGGRSPRARRSGGEGLPCGGGAGALLERASMCDLVLHRRIEPVRRAAAGAPGAPPRAARSCHESDSGSRLS